MKISKSYKALSIIVIVSMMCTAGGCQHKTYEPPTEEKLLLSAREIISAAGICTLITLDSAGHPRARAMDAFLPEDDFTVWFGTNPKSRKVKQIENDPRTTLYYFDKASGSYVMMYGKAEIVVTEEARKQYWKPEWKRFYPAYPQGYALIKFTPDWLELLSESRKINGDPMTWQPPRVYFKKAE